MHDIAKNAFAGSVVRCRRGLWATPRFLLWMLLAAVAGVLLGRWLGAGQTGLPMPGEASLEEYLSARSFSEVGNTKATLEGLCAQFLTEWRIRHRAVLLETPAGQDESRSCGGTDIEHAIRQIEEAIGEFRGTEQEVVLVNDLLYLLKHQRLYDRWLAVYVAALERAPTSRLLHKSMRDAEWIGAMIGRQTEIERTKRFLSLIRDAPAYDRVGRDQEVGALNPDGLTLGEGRPGPSEPRLNDDDRMP